MYTIRKQLRFEAAHILDSSYSKCCQGIHGHSYIVELLLQSEKLNDDGMVVDFGLVKEKVGSLIDNWDHALIVSAETYNNHFYGNKLPARIVIVPYNPTAENMAHDLFEKIEPGLSCLVKVRIAETATGWAEYERTDQ